MTVLKLWWKIDTSIPAYIVFKQFKDELYCKRLNAKVSNIVDSHAIKISSGLTFSWLHRHERRRNSKNVWYVSASIQIRMNFQFRRRTLYSLAVESRWYGIPALLPYLPENLYIFVWLLFASLACKIAWTRNVHAVPWFQENLHNPNYTRLRFKKSLEVRWFVSVREEYHRLHKEAKTETTKSCGYSNNSLSTIANKTRKYTYAFYLQLIIIDSSIIYTSM